MRRDDWLIHQLPLAMADDDFLVRYLKMLQSVSDSVLHQVDTLGHMFDPSVAPDGMVRLMAEWVGVDWVDSSLPDAEQRRIVMGYNQIIPWRGTRRGLIALLELLTDGSVAVTDSGGIFPEGEAPSGPEIVRIDLESPGWNPVPDLIRVIQSELPASVTFQLFIGADQVWPAQDDEPFTFARYTPEPAAAEEVDHV